MTDRTPTSPLKVPGINTSMEAKDWDKLLEELCIGRVMGGVLTHSGLGTFVLSDSQGREYPTTSDGKEAYRFLEYKDANFCGRIEFGPGNYEITRS